MPPLSDKYKLDRKHLELLTFEEQQARDRAYWSYRSPEERLEACEFLRQMNYGYDATIARIPRILTVIEPGGS